MAVTPMIRSDMAGTLPKKKNPYVNPAGIPGTNGPDAYKAPNNQALNAGLINAMLGSGQLTAGQVQQNAATSGVNIGTAFGTNAVAGVNQPTAVAATPAPAATATTVAPASATAPASRGPGIDWGAEATRRAAVQAQYQREQIAQSLARRLAGYDQSKGAIDQNRAQSVQQADEAANAAGFLTSGRRFALDGQVNAAAVNQQAALEEQRNMARTEASDTLGRIAREQGMNEANFRDELARQERDYNLRQTAQDSSLRLQDQQYRLGEGLMPSQLEQARLGVDQSRFNLGRDQQFLPGQLTAQQLANVLSGQQARLGDAQYGEQYRPGGVGYQSKQEALLSAIIGNQTGQAQYQDQYGGGIGQQSRQASLAGQTIANEVGLIDKQMKTLELQIAQDPNVGTRAQKQAQLDELRASLEAKQRQIGSGGLTAAQQYNQMQDRKKELTGTYKVSGTAAETWMDFQDSVGDLISGGLDPQQTEQATRHLADLMKGRALSDTDRKFLYTSLYKALGQRAPQYPDLETFRKDYKIPKPLIDPVTGKPIQ